MSTMSRYPHQPTFKPRGRRVTYHQVDALFDYLLAHQELAAGYSNSTAGRYKSQKAWETVAGMLNRIAGGARKDAKAWSAFWSNYKNKLKRRIRLARAARKNGQEPSTRLTELDVKVLPILGPLFSYDSVLCVSGDDAMKSGYSPVKSPPLGSPLSRASSPDTLPSPPPAPAYTPAATTRKTRRRPVRRPSPRINGPTSDGSDSERSIDMARLFSQTEDRTSSALLRVAGAIETLAEAAQAQAAAAHAAARGMEMIARAVGEALNKRFGAADERDSNNQ